MRISVGICFILLLSAGCSTSTIVHNTPLTFEGLANAYEADSLRSYLKDQYRWEFIRFKGDSASNFFPIQIGSFVGELTSDRHGFFYRTGDWTKALKKQAGEEIDSLEILIEYGDFVRFIDSLGKHHQVKEKLLDVSSGRIKSVLYETLNPDVNLYNVEYKRGQVEIMIIFISMFGRKTNLK